MGLLRTNKHLRNRRAIDRAVGPVPLFATVTPTVSTTTVTLTMNVPVVWNGDIPAFTVATVTVDAITRVSPTIFTLTLSGSGAGKAWTMAGNDPTFRTSTGGFVNAAAGTFP